MHSGGVISHYVQVNDGSTVFRKQFGWLLTAMFNEIETTFIMISSMADGKKSIAKVNVLTFWEFEHVKTQSRFIPFFYSLSHSENESFFVHIMRWIRKVFDAINDDVIFACRDDRLIDFPHGVMAIIFFVSWAADMRLIYLETVNNTVKYALDWFT